VGTRPLQAFGQIGELARDGRIDLADHLRAPWPENHNRMKCSPYNAERGVVSARLFGHPARHAAAAPKAERRRTSELRKRPNHGRPNRGGRSAPARRPVSAW
jgi:hypothetical protein